MKYSDRFVDQLIESGYTTVFYVAGGNIMHLLNSCRTRLNCIPVVHEVSAVIAAEYFNEISKDRAFALVTAGPGITNSVTGIAGAWLESRGVLVIGGQVKSTDLALESGVRQNGIQEINGLELVRSICKSVVRIDRVVPEIETYKYFNLPFSGRPGPVFLEFCLDVQAYELEELDSNEFNRWTPEKSDFNISLTSQELTKLISRAERPVILMGGGVSRKVASRYLKLLESLGIPLMTTWNAADRIPSSHPLYLGRPNTWGQRSSNIIIQQSDLLIAIGTRLGLQQTGFNWKEFVPNASVIQVDIDENELNKEHPKVDFRVHADARDFFEVLSLVNIESLNNFNDWLSFGHKIRELCPLSDRENSLHSGYLNPYDFVLKLSNVSPNDAVVVPCSSGGAFTTMMQAFEQKTNQIMLSNKGLASMGYGLAGAIGASIARKNSPVILVEGDGGFSQNLQELGTVIANRLPLKIFIYANQGYASIRMTQRNYFDGAYMGCDVSTGLGLPDWESIAKAYGVECKTMTVEFMATEDFRLELSDEICRLYIVPIHPEQTYFPKISSVLAENGQMVSEPLHLMSPPLPVSVSEQVFRYI
jgi:acetolactate synthase-1/2/3 large subunit